MSCPNATAPIDITLSNISGKCDLKCDYSFKYNNSSCVATNRGDYISLSYDNATSAPVVYNTVGYQVKEARIYIPSLHSYSGTKADGEFIIVHYSNAGTKPLLVCIPIKASGANSISSELFTQVVDTVSNNAPAENESTTVNYEKYNLSLFVPRKPFFSYSATEPYQPCSTDVDYIVYDQLNSSLNITPDTLNKLKTIITLNPYDIKTGPQLFYNEKGPGKGVSDDQIYIDCQPVGQSEENETVVTSTGTSGTIDLNSILNNPIFKLIIGSLIFIILLFLLSKLLGLLKPTKGGATFMTDGLRTSDIGTWI